MIGLITILFGKYIKRKLNLPNSHVCIKCTYWQILFTYLCCTEYNRSKRGVCRPQNFIDLKNNKVKDF